MRLLSNVTVFQIIRFLRLLDIILIIIITTTYNILIIPDLIDTISRSTQMFIHNILLQVSRNNNFVYISLHKCKD